MMIPQTSPYTPQPPALRGRVASTILAHKKLHALGSYDCGVFALLALASSLVACTMPAPSVPAPVVIAKVSAAPTKAPSRTPETPVAAPSERLLSPAKRHGPDADLAVAVDGKSYLVPANLPFQPETARSTSHGALPVKVAMSLWCGAWPQPSRPASSVDTLRTRQ